MPDPLRGMRIDEMEPLVQKWIAAGDQGQLVRVLNILSTRSTKRAAKLETQVRAAMISVHTPREATSEVHSSPVSRSVPLGVVDAELPKFASGGAARPSSAAPPLHAEPMFDGDLTWLHERVQRREGQVRFRFGEGEVRRFLGMVSGSINSDRVPAEVDRLWFHLRQQAERLALRPGFEELIALDANRIEELPHQTDTAIRVLQNMSGRALLADEVGLGKTIEAGLILKELLARRLVRRVVILCPAALVDQWVEEMREKFFVDFSSVTDPSDWTRHDFVIASHSRARHSSHRTHLLSRPWDMVIVDEAHKAKNHRTSLYRTLQELQRDFILLLTATPLQNELREFYNLVTLLRPGQFGTWREFQRRYVGADRRLPRDPTGIRDVASQVMVRNKRSNVNLNLPERRPHRPVFTLTPAEPEEPEPLSSSCG